MSWRAACRARALAGGRPLGVEIDGEKIALWRGEGGAPAAVADRCAHMPLPLSTGRCVQGGRLQCRHHGLEYGADGRVVGVYSHALEDGRRVKAYPAAEKSGRIWVWMGDPDKADARRIPGPLRMLFRRE